MKTTSATALAALLATASLFGCGPEIEDDFDLTQDPIVGGEDALIEDHPWQVGLYYFRFFQCGGVVLAEDWVLTAAHCVVDFDQDEFLVGAGSNIIAQPTQVVAVTEILDAPGYDRLSHDWALLRVAPPLDFSDGRVGRIEMLSPARAEAGATAPGVEAIVTGWGDTEEGGVLSPILQMVTVPIVSNADASVAYEHVIPDDVLAAGDLEKGGRDACQGDSGGPLIVEDPEGAGHFLAGLVSSGRGCARPGIPGLYTRVSSIAHLVYRDVLERCPGDFDLGGRVEQADLDKVLTRWGEPEPWSSAGVVSQADLDAVLLNWGRECRD